MRLFLLSCLVATCVGCGVELNKADADRRAPVGAGGVLTENPLQPVANTPPSTEPAANEPAANEPAAPVEDPAVTTNDAATPAEPGTIRTTAKAGVGKQGRNYGSGMVVTPVRAYFISKQKIVFEVQIPHAMRLYKATNDRFPKDFDEFKREILEPSQISLPPLPAGHKYVYDAAQGELLVEQPAR